MNFAITFPAPEFARPFRDRAVIVAARHGATLLETDGLRGQEIRWNWTIDPRLSNEEISLFVVDLLELLAALNVDLLEHSHRAGRPLPSVLDGAIRLADGAVARRIRYAREGGEGTGQEDLANVWDIHRRGWADCDDLVGAVVAERFLAGERCSPTVYYRSNGGIHAQVRLASGRIVDPSRSLGM